MKILLDENLPEGLIEPLRRLGHVVDSVGSLGLKGLANGPLYREIAVKVVLTVIRQQLEAQFVAEFLKVFASTDWSSPTTVLEWPLPS
ncbi:MAG: hypothetical protein DMD90_00925 [Candidatus Rokuibacteriota bacterium]|nr:MAG: hypothetical protein DMD90_00925 [Candidatus Rokubacteria bacterium]